MTFGPDRAGQRCRSDIRGQSGAPELAALAAGFLLFLCLLLGSAPSAAEDLEIIGSGACEGAITILAEAYMKANPGDTITLPGSVGSVGGIRGVGEGDAVLARVARRPTDEEQRRYGLSYYPFGHSAILFATHAEEHVTSLTKSELLDILSGTVTNWQELGGHDRNIRVLTRNSTDTSFLAISKAFPEIGPEVITPRAKIMLYDSEMEESIEQRRGSFGWITLDNLLAKRLAVTPVSVDGMLPTAEVIRSGTYPMILEYGLVFGGSLSPVAERFLDFAASDQAAVALATVGVVALHSKRP